ncbi:neutral zinc metallopeptidase [Streptomyces sp. ISL-98]|uniref:KPN_02809 family neutral zinc metallopeptidase n=1 Tax=Streptomyces sp. ISL-98 TaxID=2819192 RepID=UPI001BEB5009|nr:neutral zinc metallopeptidase [Streptomyces sp. ISL-98]MBT2504352.1 neutral zinc metallopeptidase [Streptomyces sp. ISL-98]
MRFDDDAGPDASDVRQVRGSRVPGGRATIGGGIVGLVALVLGVLFGVGPEQVGLSEDDPEAGGTSSSRAQVRLNCRKGRDANTDEHCRILAVVNSVQDHWRREFVRRGTRYAGARPVFFDGRAGTACGAATSAAGPFYCPGDRQVYLDLGFFDELRTTFGAGGGPFAQAYVVAHAYGHHVQNLMGTLGRARDGGQGAGSNAARVELQADCYAGVWARQAARTPEESTGLPLVTSLTDRDIEDGLDAAAEVGDDRIRERSRGRVTPESWTHGSAAQRRQWFRQGFRTGDMARCDTFAR